MRIAVLFLLLASCAGVDAPLTPKAHSVRMFRGWKGEHVHRECRALETFRFKRSRKFARNRTAELGGDAVELHKRRYPIGRATAYKCPEWVWENR